MEDLTYRRLLDWYYLHETPIPIEINETARQIRMRSHSECIATVLQEYFERTEIGWIHHRADKEIAKTGEKSEKASASAKARWNRAKDANALQAQSESNATHNTEHITQDTKPKKKATKVAATVVACPDGVGEEVWRDWLQLRKAKNAPVTQTVVNSATKEAEKAGISLNAFLTIWCARGSQGLQAEWLKTNERQTFANKYDVAGITTPPPPNQDAALRKIAEDRKKAVPPSLETLAKLAELRKSVTP
jgi:uncharacterized protein YdaU (DUF1376 family)